MGTIVSTVLQSVLSHSDYLRILFRLKRIASSPILRVSSPFLISMKAALVAKKGLPSSSGTYVSSSISIPTKSMGKIKFPTLISIFSR